MIGAPSCGRALDTQILSIRSYFINNPTIKVVIFHAKRKGKGKRTV